MTACRELFRGIAAQMTPNGGQIISHMSSNWQHGARVHGNLEHKERK